MAVRDSWESAYQFAEALTAGEGVAVVRRHPDGWQVTYRH